VCVGRHSSYDLGVSSTHFSAIFNAIYSELRPFRGFYYHLLVFYTESDSVKNKYLPVEGAVGYHLVLLDIGNRIEMVTRKGAGW